MKDRTHYCYPEIKDIKKSRSVKKWLLTVFQLQQALLPKYKVCKRQEKNRLKHVEHYSHRKKLIFFEPFVFHYFIVPSLFWNSRNIKPGISQIFLHPSPVPAFFTFPCCIYPFLFLMLHRTYNVPTTF